MPPVNPVVLKGLKKCIFYNIFLCKSQIHRKKQLFQLPQQNANETHLFPLSFFKMPQSGMLLSQKTTHKHLSTPFFLHKITNNKHFCNLSFIFSVAQFLIDLFTVPSVLGPSCLRVYQTEMGRMYRLG